jgi:hypothetical protein
LLLTESASAWQAAWSVVAKVVALEDVAEGLRYLIEKRPFGPR